MNEGEEQIRALVDTEAAAWNTRAMRMRWLLSFIRIPFGPGHRTARLMTQCNGSCLWDDMIGNGGRVLGRIFSELVLSHVLVLSQLPITSPKPYRTPAGSDTWRCRNQPVIGHDGEQPRPVRRYTGIDHRPDITKVLRTNIRANDREHAGSLSRRIAEVVH